MSLPTISMFSSYSY